MENDKSEGYPYTKVSSDWDGHTAVMIDWCPHGYEQHSLVLETHSDYIDAKRDAVELAKKHGCNFKVPV